MVTCIIYYTQGKGISLSVQPLIQAVYTVHFFLAVGRARDTKYMVCVLGIDFQVLTGPIFSILKWKEKINN